MNGAAKPKALRISTSGMSVLDKLRAEARGWRERAAEAREDSLVASPLTHPAIGVVMTAAEVQEFKVREERFATEQAEAYELGIKRYLEREALYNASPRAYRRAS